jgi:hypothetical protein
MYKRSGNLCYVFGALRAFGGHNNQDMRIKVRFDLGLLWKELPAFMCSFARSNPATAHGR